MNNDDKLTDDVLGKIEPLLIKAASMMPMTAYLPSVAKEIIQLVRDSECESEQRIDLIRRSKERLEFAESINRFSDVAFYGELIPFLTHHKEQ